MLYWRGDYRTQERKKKKGDKEGGKANKRCVNELVSTPGSGVQGAVHQNSPTRKQEAFGADSHPPLLKSVEVASALPCHSGRQPTRLLALGRAFGKKRGKVRRPRWEIVSIPGTICIYR